MEKNGSGAIPGSLKLEGRNNTMRLFVHVVQPQHMSRQVTVSSRWAASQYSPHGANCDVDVVSGGYYFILKCSVIKCTF